MCEGNKLVKSGSLLLDYLSDLLLLDYLSGVL